MSKTINPGDVAIEGGRRLYVIPAGGGFSTLGWDVAERRRRAVLAWVASDATSRVWRDILDQPRFNGPELGTVEHYNAYLAAMIDGAAQAARTGRRCPVELSPQLIGLEGQRVEVVRLDGERTRFEVGKSTGWMPCHLELRNARSIDGGPADLEYQSVRRV